MRHYCAVFDKNYLFQGVTVFRSLKFSSKEFKFYPLCMDGESYDLLTKMNLPGMVPVKLDDIMTDELVAVQNRTTKGQFCWVCQPIICQYILDKFDAEIVIYLEADSLFFSDPEAILEELGNDSISLVPHNFTPEFDNTAVAGENCVQFNAFKNDERSRDVLNYWKQNCFAYSRERLEYYPGQTCLNEWPKLFEGVKSITNIGAGVAPWNVSSYKVTNKKGQVCVNDTPVIFYHYHQYGRYQDGTHELGSYPYSKETIKFIYGKYVNELKVTVDLVHKTDPGFNFVRVYPKNTSLKALLSSNIKVVFNAYLTVIKRKIRNRYNVFSTPYFDNI
jgi:hypothetical protein